MPQDSLRDGSDVVMFSGDKLLGGPQAGIIVGKKTVIDLIKRHPLARAVRADKIALAGLGATLLHYLKDEALEQIPIWSMIAVSKEDLTVKAAAWRDTLKNAGISADLWDGESTVGGGSLPGSALPTCLLAFDLPSPDRALQTLRNGAVPVIARIERDRLVIDPRTILPGQEETLLHALLTLA
jgi:L-seryl-tRNA(Ser) seleniumtransferase